MIRQTLGVVAVLVFSTSHADDDLSKKAAVAARRASEFYGSIAAHGGYVWKYSADLSRRWGENEASAEMNWTQPPGTPTVGGAFLAVYAGTKDAADLERARLAALALVNSQLVSGGWDDSFDFAADKIGQWDRRLGPRATSEKEAKRRKMLTTFDDNKTQSCIRFLLAFCDEAKDSSDPRDIAIREARDYALEHLLKAQYPNGSFPQRYDGSPRDPKDYPVIPAKYPETWSKEFPKRAYWFEYTLNDHLLHDCTDTLIEAHRRLGKPEYLEAAKKIGDFLILAQMPDPQPGWAQQYDRDMCPTWARKFEPPSVVSTESSGAIRALVTIYVQTGDEKYLKPIPKALEWLKKSAIGSNEWARFYELQTNKPVYFTKDYKYTYSDADMPTHYGFKGNGGVEAAAMHYETVMKKGREEILRKMKPQPMSDKARESKRRGMESQVRPIVESLDEKGRWLDNGYIESKTFAKNMRILGEYLALGRKD